MSGWRDCSLGDVLTLQRGFDLPNGSRRAGKVPVVSSAGITGVHDEAKVSAPGVVIGRYGTLGEVHYVQEDFWPLNTTLWVKDFKGNYPHFCAYMLETIGIAETSGSAAVPGVNRNVLHGLPVRLPPLETQRRLASILGAYDDLIEVNRRRIAVLEEMARGLFEEWFVRFRFPGHEAVPILDTPDGPLPEGWRNDTLGNVAAINAASLRPANAPSEIGYIDISSVSPGRIDIINHMSFAEAPGRARRIVKDGSVLWSNVRPNRRSFAVVLDPTPEIVASTGFTVLDARETSFAYLYHWVTTDNFVGYLVGNAQGAAYPAVTAATFERAAILLPPADLVKRFTDFAEPMLRLADRLRKTNGSLAASRDLLLPRLISGQLSIAQAERQLEEAA